jgi:hypothetical protein
VKVLVLDDNPERLQVFAEWFKDHDLTLTNCYGDCIQALIEGSPFDLVHLDHDLNDFGKKSNMAGMYGENELTGADVAWYITIELPEAKWPRKCVIHSWNPDGARTMLNLIRDRTSIPVTYEPFTPPPQFPEQIEQQDKRR